jgi:hypothetical protein
VASLALFTGILFFVSHRGLQANVTSDNKKVRVEIALGHAKPMAVLIVGSVGLSEEIMEFSHDGTGTLALSVPTPWKEREVRGGEVAAVTSAKGGLGYTEWHLPAHMVLSFHVPSGVALLVHNPSEIPLYLKIKRIFVGRGTTVTDGILATDKDAKIW